MHVNARFVGRNKHSTVNPRGPWTALRFLPSSLEMIVLLFFRKRVEWHLSVFFLFNFELLVFCFFCVERIDLMVWLSAQVLAKWVWLLKLKRRPRSQSSFAESRKTSLRILLMMKLSKDGLWISWSATFGLEVAMCQGDVLTSWRGKCFCHYNFLVYVWWCVVQTLSWYVSNAADSSRYILSFSSFVFRAKFYHSDPELRKQDSAGTRRKGRKKSSGGNSSSLTAAQVLDGLDAELVSGDQSTTTCNTRPDFPADGWTSDSSELPKNISLGVIFDHLRACGKNVGVKKPFTRGFNFYFWSYIHAVEVSRKDSRYFFRAKCWASQSKKENYALECVLQPAASTYLMSVVYVTLLMVQKFNYDCFTAGGSVCTNWNRNALQL